MEKLKTVKGSWSVIATKHSFSKGLRRAETLWQKTIFGRLVLLAALTTSDMRFLSDI